MSLRFPYQPVRITGPVPPTLPGHATVRWRPFVPLRITNPATGQFRDLRLALADSGADDTVFSMTLVSTLGINLLPDVGGGHSIRWGTSSHAIRFGEVRLDLSDGTEVWSWTTIVAFSSAPLRYPLLGQASFLQFFDVTFRGEAREVIFDTNPSFIGTKT